MSTHELSLKSFARNPWFRTLTAYGFTQLLLAVGAFARIPLIVAAVGGSGYGLIIVYGGLCVVILAIADGISQSARSIFAETGSPSPAIMMTYQRVAVTQAIAVFTLFSGGTIVAVCIAKDIDGPWAAGMACLAFASLAILGAPAKGLLEGQGSTAIVHLLQTSTTLVGLPFLVVALHYSETLMAAAVVTGLGLSLPYLGAVIVVRLRILWTKNIIGRPFRLGRMYKLPEWSHIKQMIVWAWANSMNYAFDAAIIGAIVGTLAAGEFGLASRIMTLAMLLSLALNPLITSRVSRWRVTLSVPGLLKRTRILSLCMTLLAITMAALSITIAPPIAKLLSHGEIEAPGSLYIWLGIFAVASAATAPLMALFAGAGGAKYRARMSAMCACINVILSLILARFFGAEGPVMASVLALSLLSTLLLIRAKKAPHILTERH